MLCMSLLLIIVRYQKQLAVNIRRNCKYVNHECTHTTILLYDNRGKRVFVIKRFACLKKDQNAPRPSEHPPVRGEKSQNV